jgi:hypothetical protein
MVSLNAPVHVPKGTLHVQVLPVSARGRCRPEVDDPGHRMAAQRLGESVGRRGTLSGEDLEAIVRERR